MDMPQFEFKNMIQLKTFINLNKTDTANYLFSESIKIIGKEQDVYYYENKKKLWCCVTKEVYINAIADYFNDIGKCLSKSLNEFLREDAKNHENDLDYIEEVNKLRQQVMRKQNDLDSSVYMKTIIERSTGKLQDNTFPTKLNSDKDYFKWQKSIAQNWKS